MPNNSVLIKRIKLFVKKSYDKILKYLILGTAESTVLNTGWQTLVAFLTDE